MYKHHLEQTYKLCRPCQTAVEYYIKHQNRQLRGVVFNHQLQRSRDSDKAFVRVGVFIILSSYLPPILPPIFLPSLSSSRRNTQYFHGGYTKMHSGIKINQILSPFLSPPLFLLRAPTPSPPPRA